MARPIVSHFAEAMEQKLKENDYKGGWSGCTPSWLLRRLRAEINELARALKHHKRTPALIAREAADVANFAMMIADVTGGLADEIRRRTADPSATGPGTPASATPKES